MLPTRPHSLCCFGLGNTPVRQTWSLPKVAGLPQQRTSSSPFEESIQQICHFPSVGFRKQGVQLTLSSSSLAHPFLLDQTPHLSSLSGIRLLLSAQPWPCWEEPESIIISEDMDTIASFPRVDTPVPQVGMPSGPTT